ncbi:glutathione S-transferase [Candidatus Uabimicrobium amorphum]|uniref:glutathione S-transferase n=1 Tax=Uabimicrobium amorphum TaxID=2596890 RepID=UPI00125EA2E9
MITVHHLESSRSQKILWLLEELQLEYKIEHYKRNKVTNLAPPELKKIHPLGKSPVVTDGENVIAETGAIIEYFVDKYTDKNLKPAAGTPEYMRYTYWLHTAEGSIMPLLVMKLIFGVISTKSPFFVRPIAKAISGQVNNSYIMPGLNNMFAYIEAELNRSSWLAGDQFSAADIIMSNPVEGAIAQGVVSPNQHPKIYDFLTRIQQREGYQKSVEKGGTFIPTNS